MKSYLFTTANDRGGVMLCDIDEFDAAVDYLCERFDGVVRVEAGEQVIVSAIRNPIRGMRLEAMNNSAIADGQTDTASLDNEA